MRFGRELSKHDGYRREDNCNERKMREKEWQRAAGANRKALGSRNEDECNSGREVEGVGSCSWIPAIRCKRDWSDRRVMREQSSMRKDRIGNAYCHKEDEVINLQDQIEEAVASSKLRKCWRVKARNAGKSYRGSGPEMGLADLSGSWHWRSAWKKFC